MCRKTPINLINQNITILTFQCTSSFLFEIQPAEYKTGYINGLFGWPFLTKLRDFTGLKSVAHGIEHQWTVIKIAWIYTVLGAREPFCLKLQVYISNFLQIVNSYLRLLYFVEQNLESIQFAFVSHSNVVYGRPVSLQWKSTCVLSTCSCHKCKLVIKILIMAYKPLIIHEEGSFTLFNCCSCVLKAFVLVQ